MTGGSRNLGLLASRGIKIKPKEESLSGNMVVFSASQEDQSALPYHDEKHGVFTRKGNRIVVGGSSVYPSAILADPDKYFTEDVIQKLEEAANEEFSYGE